MAHRVQIASGKSHVQLPDGGAYDAGTIVNLTDAQFALIRSSLFPSVVIDLGVVGGTGISSDDLATALTALNVGQYIDTTELAAAFTAQNLSQYTDAGELAAAISTAIAALNVSQYTDPSELAAAISAAIAGLPAAPVTSVGGKTGAVPILAPAATSVKTAPYTASIGETVLVDMTGRGVADAVYINASATVTSATMAFTSADQGKVISASTQFVPKGTTVLTVNSSTSITMSANARAAASGKFLDLPGGGAVILPSSAPSNSIVIVKKVDWSPTPVPVTPSGGDDIDGQSLALVRGRNIARWFVKGTGTSWAVISGLVPVNGSPASSSFDKALSLYMPSDNGLNNLRGALTRAKASFGNPARILCKGDSTTYGVLGAGGNGASSTYNPGSLVHPPSISWVDRCRRLLTTSQVLGGRIDEGAIHNPATGDTRFTLGTGWNAGWTAASTASGNFTFVDDNQSNAYDITIIKNTGATSFNVTIDSETPVAVNISAQTNATTVTYTVTSTVGVGTHTVVVSPPNAAQITILAIIPKNTATLPVATMSTNGVSGQTLATYVGGSSQSNSGYWSNTLTHYKPDAAFLLMGVNDMHGYVGGSIPTNVATYKTNLTTFTTACQAQLCDPIFITFPSRGYAGVGPSDSEAYPYHQAIYEVADDYGVPVLDLQRRWQYGWTPVNWTAESSINPVPMYDGVHPTLAGYQDIAHMVSAFLTKIA